jgi:hypothetical protein
LRRNSGSGPEAIGLKLCDRSHAKSSAQWPRRCCRQRSAFLQAIAVELARYSADARGPGRLHWLTCDLQHTFLKNGPFAAGDKYGRPHSLRAAPAKSARDSSLPLPG